MLTSRYTLRLANSGIGRFVGKRWQGSVVHSMTETTKNLADGIRRRERFSLAKAITLVESSNKEHRIQASLILEYLAQTGTIANAAEEKPSLRIGIAGPPG